MNYDIYMTADQFSFINVYSLKDLKEKFLLFKNPY